MNRKIFKAVWFTSLIVLAASLLVIMGSLYTYFNSVQKKQLKTETQFAAKGVELNGMDYFDGLAENEYRITWIAADGTVLYDNESDSSKMENHLEREEVKEALETGYGEASRYSNTLSKKQLYCAMLLSDGTVLRVSSSQDSIWLLMVGFLQPICIVVLLALILSFILAFSLSRKIVEPINNIDPDDPVKYIDKEEYAEVAPLLRKMRVQQLEIQKNQEELEKSSIIRQEFTANVSHELKTPLHSISGYAEIIENGMAKEEDVKPFAGKIRAEAARLTNLVEDIIELTKLDGGAVDANMEEINVYKLAENAIDSVRRSADEKNVEISLTGDEKSYMVGDSGIILGVIYNLVDNAVKYNHEGGKVTVEVSDINTSIKISVSDTGIGIPKEHQDRIFERFYRVDKSHSKAVGGTGLGLSIAKHGVMVHSGEISVASKEGEGTTFTVVLPKSGK